MNDNKTFMGKYALLVYASILAVAVGAFATFRIEDQSKQFNKKVKETLMVSEGYDQQFIDMVNRLEDELAERASFGYAGRRDPMTGATRAVAVPVRRPSARKAAAVAAAQQDVDDAVQLAAVEEIDPVRLTAIIFDNTKRVYTAIVMDGDRSFSVEIGDRIAGRRITRITHEEIHMEDNAERFVYNILGGSTRMQK